MTFEKVNHCLLEVRASDKLHAKIRKLISLKELPFVLKERLRPAPHVRFSKRTEKSFPPMEI